MVYSLAWLPDALLGAGLKVAPVDGWEIRRRSTPLERRPQLGRQPLHPSPGCRPPPDEVGPDAIMPVATRAPHPPPPAAAPDSAPARSTAEK